MLSTSAFGHVPRHLLFSDLVLHSGYCFCAGHYHSTLPVPHPYSVPACLGSLYSGGNISTLSFASMALLSTMSAQLWPLLTRFKFFHSDFVSGPVSHSAFPAHRPVILISRRIPLKPLQRPQLFMSKVIESFFVKLLKINHFQKHSSCWNFKVVFLSLVLHY